MKTRFVIIIGVFITVSSCIGGTSKFNKKPKFEFGEVEGNKYTNDYFGLEVSLPETWTLDTNKKFQSPFSPHFLEIDLFDEDENALISFNILGHRKNPFSRDETLISYLKENNEGLTLFYDENEHHETFIPTKIDNTDFILNRVILNSDNQNTFVDEYATVKFDYFYSLTFSYTDTLQRTEINKILQDIHIK
jgi:hypothetical protein